MIYSRRLCGRLYDELNSARRRCSASVLSLPFIRQRGDAIVIDCDAYLLLRDDVFPAGRKKNCSKIVTWTETGGRGVRREKTLREKNIYIINQ